MRDKRKKVKEEWESVYFTYIYSILRRQALEEGVDSMITPEVCSAYGHDVSWEKLSGYGCCNEEGVTRDEVLGEVLELLCSTYEFNINPLPGLRKYFPLYKWNHVDSEAISDLPSLVLANDFTWRMNNGTLVTAKRDDRDKPLAIICFQAFGNLITEGFEECTVVTHKC